MRSLASISAVSLVAGAAGQAGLVTSTPTDAAAGSGASAATVPTVRQMFEEANTYVKSKAAEYLAKKIAYSDDLLVKTQREQKQLAARYAAQTKARENLAGEDFYYLGMLHWISENLDGTVEALTRFLATENPAPDRVQTARSIIVVVSAKRRNTEKGEIILADYLKS